MKRQAVRLNPRTGIDSYPISKSLTITNEPTSVSATVAKKLVGLKYKGVELVIVEEMSDKGSPEMNEDTTANDKSEDESL